MAADGRMSDRAVRLLATGFSPALQAGTQDEQGSMRQLTLDF
jgi:hypothetical protein